MLKRVQGKTEQVTKLQEFVLRTTYTISKFKCFNYSQRFASSLQLLKFNKIKCKIFTTFLKTPFLVSKILLINLTRLYFNK